MRAPVPRYVSIEIAAEMLGVTVRSIRRWIADGTIPASRIGSKVVRIREDDLLAAMRPIPAASDAA
ncbi:MAG: hypothetical protein BGO26_16700 [Actinobacteria bacterium 69-20]|nr:helix-turn-helix domain-containing protein [Actinomycetota bacterium]OJV27112.1 MAG: hypothetical protein BGO26_16700 [Actinobacteria bacterium 69-20]